MHSGTNEEIESSVTGKHAGKKKDAALLNPIGMYRLSCFNILDRTPVITYHSCTVVILLVV